MTAHGSVTVYQIHVRFAPYLLQTVLRRAERVGGKERGRKGGREGGREE